LTSDLLCWSISLLLGSSNSGRAAIHVKFAVTDLVDPRPCNCVVTWCDAFGNGVLEVGCALTARVGVKVTSDVGRATTLDGVNDHPFGVLGWLEIGRQADLARSAAVNSAADEAQSLWFTDSHDVRCSFSLVDTSALFAWEIGAVAGEGRVVER